MSGTGITDYGHFGSQNVPGATPPVSSGGTTSTPASASSIQKSELEALAQLIVAGIPILIQPQVYGNSVNGASASASASIGSISMEVAQKEHDIISKMWDTYIANIREIAEKIRKEDVKRQTLDETKPGAMSSVQYFAYLISLPATKRSDEIEGNGNALASQFTAAFNQWFVNPLDSGASASVAGITGAYPSSSFAAGALASSPDAIRSAVGVDSAALGVYLSASPVADALYAAGPTSGLPGDVQAAGALVAAWLYAGSVLKATADTIASAGGKPPQDLNFAVNFAQQIVAIVTKNIGSQDQTDPNRAGQNNMVRLMLAAMALNLVYRAAYGGMQGKELTSLIAGQTGDIPTEIKGLVDQLVGLINAYLPKNAGSREETLARLGEYVDSKESVDSMLETTRLFTSFLKAGDLDAKRLASNNG